MLLQYKILAGSIAAGLALAVSFGAAWSYQENKYEAQIKTIRAGYATQMAQVQTANSIVISGLNNTILSKSKQFEQELRDTRNEINTKSNSTVDGIRNGSIVLRDKYQTSTRCSSNNQPSANPESPTNGHRVGTVGELSGQTAETLIRLTQDADNGNEALKTCIKMYNNVKENMESIK